jgi:anion-transporting  ArsA/GET3 family ATPase
LAQDTSSTSSEASTGSPNPTGGATAPRALLDHRLVIVTGKGGTGKTTVAAALAFAAALRGRRVLVAEVAPCAQIPRLLDPGSEPVGYAVRELRPRLLAMRIDPYEALAEYLGLQLGLRPLVDRVLANQAFRQLMTASPGWRELITLGKIWHLEQMREGDRPLYDLIVVDAPATGHGVTFLDVPRVVVSAVRAGPLRHHTERVESLIEDPERTLLLPVALAEELPARETADLVEDVRARLAVRLDRVVINGVHPPPFPEGLQDLDERLAGLPADLSLDGLPPTPTLAACAGFLRARHELNRGYVDEIARSTGLPTICLPYLREGIRGPDDVARLATGLVDAVPEAA